MHRPAHCLTTAMDLKDAAAFLATHHNICGAPVVDNDGRVVEVVSKKDFLRRMGLGNPLAMPAVALLINNLAPARRYPEFWW